MICGEELGKSGKTGIISELGMSPSCQTLSNACWMSKPKGDLFQFKGGGYSVNQSVTLLDGGVEGVKAELVFGDCVGYKWDKS